MTLGKVSYHIPCHLRVQNVGQKTREMLQMIPGATVNTVERCAGHDGTWGVKEEYYDLSMKIGKPVFKAMASDRSRLHKFRLRHCRPSYLPGHGQDLGPETASDSPDPDRLRTLRGVFRQPLRPFARVAGQFRGLAPPAPENTPLRLDARSSPRRDFRPDLPD